MKTGKRYNIFFFGLTGLLAGLGYFLVLHFQKPFQSPTVIGYALCLSVALCMIIYFIAVFFELDNFFRYHLLIVLGVIIFSVRMNSVLTYSVFAVAGIAAPPLIMFLSRKIYCKTMLALSRGKPSRVSDKPVASERRKPAHILRDNPRTLSEDDIKAMLKEYNFFDRRWNESGEFQNEFEDNGDGTVTDHATGLMWQKSGSENRMPYKDVFSFAEKVNREKFAGYDDWRLPTIDELASLLESEEKNEGLHIDPIFDKSQWWCWSSDKRSGGGVWYVYFNHGLVNRNYEYVDNDVRLVRRGQ